MIGQYSTSNLLQKKFLENLPIARKTLSLFNTLNTLFSSFDNYEKREYEKTKNIILRLCLPDNYGKTNTERLAEVEDSLLIFDVLNWNKAERNRLKDRLCSDDYHLSLTQYTELTYAKWLAEKLGKINVKIYPRLQTGKISDILVNLETKSIYLEVGNLSESLPEKKIQKVLDEAASHLGRKLKDSVIVLLEVDTAKLLIFDMEKHIDVKASIEKLTSELDRLCIDELTNYEGVLNIEEIAETLTFKGIIEDLLKRDPALIPPSEKEKLELINSPAISRWIDASKGQMAKGSKIVGSISRYKGRFLLVEVHQQMLYPSAAALSERDSFINHVVRHIKSQLEQLQPGSPNIIVVQGFNWVMFGLGEDFEAIEPLKSKIDEFLIKNHQKYLSGIAIFANDFAGSILIPNKQAAKESRLSNDDVEKLGMRII